MPGQIGLIHDPSPIVAVDPLQAQSEIASVFSPHTLTVTGTAAQLDVQLSRASLCDLTLAELSHGAEVDITPGRLRTYFNVNVILQGHTRTTCGDQTSATGPGQAAVLSPDHSATMRWSADCRQLAVKIDRAAVQRELQAHLGHPVDVPITFAVAMDTRSGAGACWLTTVMSLIGQLNSQPDLIRRPMVGRRFESLVISQLLSGQPHNYTDDLLGAGRRTTHPRRIQLVVDLIQARAAEPLTATDLARAAGVCLRSLQDDFRQHVGVSPMTYLRDVRLRGAHEDITSGRLPAGTTVADVAYKWGFGHVSRFAASYRERYGEPPSAALRG